MRAASEFQERKTNNGIYSPRHTQHSSSTIFTIQTLFSTSKICSSSFALNFFVVVVLFVAVQNASKNLFGMCGHPHVLDDHIASNGV